MNLNVRDVPSFSVRLEDLDHYADIKQIFRNKGVLRYTYVIKYNDEPKKIGIQYKIQEPADRIYTQIGHMPGWRVPLLQRSKKTTGKSIKNMIDKIDPENFHKDNVEIEFYDFTDFKFKLSTSDAAVYAEMQNIEEEMKQIYFKSTGKYPIGNIKQEATRAVAPDRDVWNDLFG